MKMSEDTDTRIAVHEAICAERYKHIEESLSKGEARMTKIEYLLYAVMLCILFGPGVAAEFVKKLLGL